MEFVPVGRASGAAREMLAAAVRRSPHGLESRIAGTSMEPTIPDGATIRVSALPDGACRTGMVVACLSAGQTLFAHRVVHCAEWRGRRHVLTLGDGWLLCDPPTASDEIVGEVSEYRHEGDWHRPGGPAARRSWSRLVSRTSVRMVKIALAIHPWLARRVAGTGLVVGSLLKTIGARLGRS